MRCGHEEVVIEELGLDRHVATEHMYEKKQVFLIAFFVFVRSSRYLRICAGIICDSGAASMMLCHVLVELGMTKPKSKDHSSSTLPCRDNVNKNLCDKTEKKNDNVSL